jgi:hypothetical protein
VARLKAFRRRSEVSGNLMICARFEARVRRYDREWPGCPGSHSRMCFALCFPEMLTKPYTCLAVVML